jgi:hypothetical protein
MPRGVLVRAFVVVSELGVAGKIVCDGCPLENYRE